VNKNEFYRIQAEAFKDYAQKYSDKENLLSLYNKWVKSKDIFGVDRHQIWLRVRDINPGSTIIVKNGTDSHYRLTCFLDFIHKIDMANLQDILEKMERTKHS
jgi:hypothetical protein